MIDLPATEKRIIAEPADDDLRLVFADELEDAGDVERALMVREAVRRWSTGGVMQPALPAALSDRLLGPLHQICPVSARFWRGFPQTLTLTAEDYIAHGERLFALSPAWSAQLWSAAPTFPLAAVLGASQTAKLRGLSLASPTASFDREQLEMLLASENLSSLLELQARWKYEHPEPDWRAVARRIYDHASFRKLIKIDLGIPAEAWPGDKAEESPKRALDTEDITTYHPMSVADRELELRYGYIPRMHAANWSLGILEVLRGELPYPVGAPPVEAMYDVPPPKVEHVMNSEW